MKSPDRDTVHQLLAAARRSAGRLAEFIWGEDCAACGTEVRPGALFCPACLGAVRVVSDPWCPRCGVPYPAPPTRLCGRCAAGRSFFRTIRVRWLYRPNSPASDPVASAIWRFKYRGHRRIGSRLAVALVPLVSQKRYDLVMPVPLHVRRLRGRGFNQAAVLAAALGRACGLETDSCTLVRSRSTGSQVGRSGRGRLLNVAGAFSVLRPDRIAAASVLLVDDVVTSAATVGDCCRALRSAGASSVDVVALARTAP